MKTALITGTTGQDGSYLAKSLLNKGYKVYGGERRSTTNKYWRLDEMCITDDIEFVELDVIDQANIRRAIEKTKPDVVYNLAAQSFVGLSFEQPELATLIDAMGVLRMVESIRQVNPKIKFYQASTSELYGKVQETPQTEKTPFYPRSPYGVAKTYSHHLTVNYRESFKLFACSGILFNHESRFRGEEFVTRKITKGIVEYSKTGKPIELGNLDAKRDWGHAQDYVEAMWLMLQQDKPDDYVISTGQTHTVREFIRKCLDYMDIPYKEEGHEFFDTRNNQVIVKTNPKFFRPAEVDLLIGDCTKAKEKLGWTPKHDLGDLIRDMIGGDLERYV